MNFRKMGSMGVRRYLVFLMGLPVLLLLMKPVLMTAVMYAAAYVVLCLAVVILLGNDKFSGCGRQNVLCVPVTLGICVLLSRTYYLNWYLTDYASGAAAVLHITPKKLLLGVGIVLLAAAVPGINYLMSILYNICRSCNVGPASTPFVHAEQAMSSDSEAARTSAQSSGSAAVTPERITHISVREWALCAAIALIASCQLILNPLHNYIGGDLPVFLYIGKMMHQGYIPYRDMFDHKGIILYFIQYIGWFINIDGYYGVGVWLLEVLSLTFFAAALLKLSRLITKHVFIQYITIFVVPVFVGGMMYGNGDNVQEFALPWITFSMYIMLKYIISEQFRYRDIAFMGIALVVVLFLLPNVIGVWLVYVPYIIFLLMRSRQFEMLWRCIGTFTAGMCLAACPLLIYFCMTDSLKDMMECYFIFNFAYTGEHSTFFHIINSMYSLLSATGPAVVLLLAAFVYCGWNRIYTINLVYFSIALILAAVSGRYYGHYVLPLLPAIAINMIYSFELLVHVCKILITWMHKTCGRLCNMVERIFNRGTKVLNGACAVICLIIGVVWATELNYANTYNSQVVDINDYIKEYTDVDEDVLVIAGASPEYLLTDRHTENKYFYQTPPLNISDDILADFIEELSIHPSSVIVMPYVKSEALAYDSNLGTVCRYLEDKCKNGEFECEDYGTYYVYRRV